MNNITALFKDVYQPMQALVVFQHATDDTSFYIESYDMDEQGRPINAHPLNEEEMGTLADLFSKPKPNRPTFLEVKGLLPENVLCVRPADGFALWYTPARQQPLFFADRLGIQSGKASVPALLWKASLHQLTIFALREFTRPTLNTKVDYAPFFNINSQGLVCMGTVNTEIPNHIALEDFMQAWETFFFNSYFSHLTGNHCPVAVNIVQLWQELVLTDLPFPTAVLMPSRYTLKDLLK